MYCYLDGAPGVAADLGHINTRCKVTGYSPDFNGGVESALSGAKVVVITAGHSQSAGKTSEELFAENAPIIAELVGSVAKYAPNACLCIISNPVCQQY